MKYSILLPYYKRYNQFRNTLISFIHHYKDRNDFEILVGEDYKNSIDENENEKIRSLVNEFSNKLKIKLIETYFDNVLNPCLSFNKCASFAEGEFLIISNPECFHQTSILYGLDEDISSYGNNLYIICSCEAVSNWNNIDTFDDLKYELDLDSRIAPKHRSWLQHSVYNNRMLHFCSCISKENFDKLNGFDANYRYGVGFEDNDFIKSIEQLRLTIKLRDDLKVLHLNHERTFQADPDLLRINSTYYNKKWGVK